jgi:hypothetical protein
MEFDRMTRPRIALIVTTYFKPAHADVIGTRLIEGYPWNGEEIQSRVEVAGMYLEQIHPDDIGLEIARRNDVPLYPSVAECMALGGTGVQVDGVVIVGEHGDYGLNEFGQTLYPRRRLFDSAISTMIGAGKFVPIFSDKHFAWSTADAQAMYNLARRHDIPLLAGSSVPLAWRIPLGTDWPLGEPIDTVVAVSYGPTESYGFHALEAMQVIAERRSGGETGVLSVRRSRVTTRRPPFPTVGWMLPCSMPRWRPSDCPPRTKQLRGRRCVMSSWSPTETARGAPL